MQNYGLDRVGHSWKKNSIKIAKSTCGMQKCDIIKVQ